MLRIYEIHARPHQLCGRGSIFILLAVSAIKHAWGWRLGSGWGLLGWLLDRDGSLHGVVGWLGCRRGDFLLLSPIHAKESMTTRHPAKVTGLG